MASGKQITEQVSQTFQTWLASKVDLDFRQIASCGDLSRKEITKECGFAMAEMGIGDESTDQNDITVLRYVRSSVDKRAAEEIADRTPCADFDKTKPLFKLVERELKLKTGVCITLRFGRDTSMSEGQ